MAWQCYQQLRPNCHAGPVQSRQISLNLLDSFPRCPIPEITRLGRTLKSSRAQVLISFDTARLSNGATEPST